MEKQMKKIVIYQSGTGFTAKYAEWIAQELGCEAKEFKKVKTSDLTEYDVVIYGGYIMANMVFGYDKIKALNLRKVVVFGVGMSLASEEYTKKIAEQNEIQRESLFYFEGGYNPKKVGFFKKIIMNMIKKSIEQKTEKTKEDLHMLETFQGADRTNLDYIKPLIQAIQEME